MTPLTSRLPTKEDFPSQIKLSIIAPPNAQAPLNVVVLLHGLGDTELPFANLGRQLNLPYTACISVRGPAPVPGLFTGSDGPAFHWGDDILIDQSSGDLDLDGCGYDKSSTMLWDHIIDGVLFKECGYRPRDIIFFGFGQGAVAALRLAATHPELEFGGVVAIGGRLPSGVTPVSSSSSSSGNGKAKTPILVLGGSRSRQVTRSAVDGLKQGFGEVEYVNWVKGEDSMPASREEMLPIMRFLARRLRSRAGVPEGAVEIR
jgi:predicted esterase